MEKKNNAFKEYSDMSKHSKITNNNRLLEYQYFNNQIPYNKNIENNFRKNSKNISEFNTNIEKLYKEQIKIRNFDSKNSINIKSSNNNINNKIYYNNNCNISNNINIKKHNYTIKDIDPLNLLKSQKINKIKLIENYVTLLKLYEPSKGGNKSIYNNIKKALYLLNKV